MKAFNKILFKKVQIYQPNQQQYLNYRDAYDDGYTIGE